MIFAPKKIVSVLSVRDSEHRGVLYPLELPNLPFEPKRIFWITDVPAEHARGGHAHIECKQLYFCISGSIKVTYNDGEHKCEFNLNKGDVTFIKELIWTEEVFQTEDSILLVICSHEYNAGDYINTIEKLKEYLEKKSNG
jgi:hypothetical protein